MIYLILSSWLVCGLLSYGYNLAYYQRHYPTIAKEQYNQDRFHCFAIALFGPIGLLVVIMSGHHRHGLMYSRDHSQN